MISIIKVNAYGLNGLGSEAIELYLRLSLEHIDEVTHICILNACSHSGLITEARSIFDRIQMKTDRIIAVMVINNVVLCSIGLCF